MTLLLIVLLVLLIVGLPVFPHSRSWGYSPSAIVLVVLVIVVVLIATGRVHI